MKKLICGIAAVAGCAVIATGAAACGAKATLKVKEIELTSEEYAFAIAKENDALLGQVNGYLAEWEADGSLDKLINSYFDGTASFSYENKTSTAQEGDLVLATNAYFPPFESYDENHKFVGVDIEIAYKIAAKLNKTLFIHDMEFDAIITSVKSGASDIGMAGITVNETRKEQVNFSDGYYESSQVITVLENDASFDECKTAGDIEEILKAQSSSFIIGTQKGTTGYMYSKGDEDFGYDGFANLTTNGYNTGALAMMDLQNGKINAVILDKQPSLMLVNSMNK